MLFHLISDCPQKFNNNPLFIESSNLPDDEECFYLIDGLEKAISLNLPAEYLNYKIKDNIWWFYDTPDEVIIEILQQKKELINIIPILNAKELDEEYISYNNKKIIAYFDGLQIFLIDHSISDYFCEEKYYPKIMNYENYFRLIIKQMGLVTENHTEENLKNYLITLFDEEYWIYIPIVFFELISAKQKYLADFDYNGETKNAWKELFKVENYLNQVKIYSIDSKVINFNIQKDDKGFYVQNKYRGSEGTTGRIFAYDLNGNQSLQNLGKEYRNILNAEENCYLLETDYKSFEFNILLCLIDEKSGEDHQQKIIDYLFGDKKVNRSEGKKINYSIIYGKSIEKISKELSEKYAMDKKILYSKLKKYYIYQKAKELREYLTRCNYRPSKKLLRNYFNRWIKIEKEYAILNNYIQSSGSDFFYFKFNLLVDFLKQFDSQNKILFQNHDSIMFQLQISNNSEKIFRGIMEILNQPYKQLSLEADYKYGTNWALLE